jgi:hypothetical protein
MRKKNIKICKFGVFFLQIYFVAAVLKVMQGHAIAQAVSRRLPIATVRVRALVRSYGICGGRSGIGAGFLRVLRFPLPVFIPPIAPHSASSVAWGWYDTGRSTK